MSLEKSTIEIDAVQLYFGEPLIINEHIKVMSPTVGDFIKTGESKYFGTLHMLTAIPSDMKASLWDMGICWMDISDFDFFCLLTRSLGKEDTKVFLGDLDLSEFEFDPKNDFLYKIMPDGTFIVINEEIYQAIVTTLRTIHGIVPKPEKVKSDSMKELMIQLNREDIEKAKREKKSSTLLPLISSMLNSPGFKYDMFSIKQVPYYAFMDSIKRIPVISNAMAMLQGIYGGWVDTSKLDKNILDWMRDLDKKINVQKQTKKEKKN